MRNISRWLQNATTPRPRRTGLPGFTGVSDRLLADIGVRRMDLQAASLGLGRIERVTRCASAPAKVYALRACAGATGAADPVDAAA